MQDYNKRSISFRELLWDEVDGFARNHGFKDRSPFIEYCVSKEMYRKRFGDIRLIEIALICGMLLILVVTVSTLIRMW